MDFRGREANFQEAYCRYAELIEPRDAGRISDEEFEAQRQQLMVQDDKGRRWTKFSRSGGWHYRDGSTWARGIPPGYQEVFPEPASPPARTASPLQPKGAENKENGRRRAPPSVLVAGLGGICPSRHVLESRRRGRYLQRPSRWRLVRPQHSKVRDLRPRPRNAMLEGATFDVAVLEEPTEAGQ